MKLFWMVLPLFLVSCASADDAYPPNWVPLRTNAACSDIVGIYENTGELAVTRAVKNVELDNYKPKLSDELFQTPKDRIAANRADLVEIVRHNAVLYVRALRNSNILVSVQYPKSHLRCNDGWLTVATKSFSPDSVLGVEQDSVMLHLAMDGSLVVKRLSKGAGLAFFAIPAVGSTVTYMRFQKQR